MSANIPEGEKPEEIEVTDEMIKAGAEAIGTGDLTFTTAGQMAAEVYRAMEAARKKRSCSS